MTGDGITRDTWAQQEPSHVCEGCHGFGGNWDCGGENDIEECNCLNCTGSDACPECGE